MKLIVVALAIVCTVLALPVKAQMTMICETASGVQFVWVGTHCPVGSYFVSF